MRGDEPARWPVLSRSLLATGRVSAFVDEEILTPAGETISRQFLTHPGAVAVVAWREESDDVAIVRQYRHPVGMELAEIPAGLLDLDGEDYVAAAARELAEEAELQASRWNVLVDICTSPGACAESLRIYLARAISPAERPAGFVLEAEEAHMTCSWVPRSDIVDAIFEGRCQSPTLVAGVLALETALIAKRLDSLRPADAPWPIRRR